jgi:hypothetical protein
MGIAIPQVLSEDKASGAQVIDGSLRFDGSKSHYLSRTPGSVGNRKTWTFSCWLKRTNLSNRTSILTAGSDGTELVIQSDGTLLFYYYTTSYQGRIITVGLLRDISSWYNIVLSLDTTQSTNSTIVKFYINGIEQVVTYNTNWSTNLTPDVNNTSAHYIGKYSGTGQTFNGEFYLSQLYLIDGQALDASYFGYTDALTNTWRPKKFPQMQLNSLMDDWSFC